MERRYPPWIKSLLIRIFKTTTDPLAFFEKLAKQGDIVRIPVFKPNYLINDPEAIHTILLTHQDNYTKIGTGYERIENAIGRGLLTTSGEEWAHRRQQFQPAFQGKRLKNFIPTIQKYTLTMLNQWETKNGQKLNITEEMLSLGMNISSEAFLGVDVSDRSLEMVRMIHILNTIAVRSLLFWKWIPTMRNLRYQVAKKTVDNFILSSLKGNIQKDPKPLLDNLLEKDDEGNLLLPQEAILGEAKNFFIAGHETTGNALSWALYLLAKNPYVLTQVLNEIKHVLGTQLPNDENLEDLSYLDLVILETLRLYPPIWIFNRRSLQEDTILNYTIPPRAIINISPYLIHRHPKYWNQPNTFYPERFLSEASRSRPKCAYIPFGFGPRVCIGRQFALLNMKIILVMILQRFKIELPNKTYIAKPFPYITLKPQKDLHLKIEKIIEEDK